MLPAATDTSVALLETFQVTNKLCRSPHNSNFNNIKSLLYYITIPRQEHQEVWLGSSYLRFQISVLFTINSWFLTLEDETDILSRNVGKEL